MAAVALAVVVVLGIRRGDSPKRIRVEAATIAATALLPLSDLVPRSTAWTAVLLSTSTLLLGVVFWRERITFGRRDRRS
jgi:hypothetical protein